jgi:hypothetical protein
MKRYRFSRKLMPLLRLKAAVQHFQQPVLIGTEPVIGMEANYGDLVFFRAGLGNLQRVTEFGGKKRLLADPSAGIGLHLGSF